MIAAPVSSIARRIWFYFETLTGRLLDIDDAPRLTAVPALDKRFYFTGKEDSQLDTAFATIFWAPEIFAQSFGARKSCRASLILNFRKKLKKPSAEWVSNL